MDSTDFRAPCNCGAFGDHPSNANCEHGSAVEIEVTGGRSACLQAIGSLRSTGYLVDIEHEWQDPETEQWVFKIGASNYVSRFAPPLQYTPPPTPTPEAAVLEVLNASLGVEASEYEIEVLTNLSPEILANTLTALVEAGEIQCLNPGVYRKDA
ncbi:hypothetical protein [Streptomyces sp. NPDC102282]|uniref:hypothetical protein n=1 Tax=Streptomyces sp. NPDC102282 TaxID=3366154 RepID=UPI00382FD99A